MGQYFGSLKGDLLIDLDENSDEFIDVKNHFIDTFGIPSVRVLQVLKVNNPPEYGKFEIQRSHVSSNLEMDEDNVERMLWHGTTEYTALEIARFSFNRSYAGKNGTIWGMGTYFAKNSSYSHEYTSANFWGERCMLWARVIVGDFTIGDKHLRDAPRKDPHQKYDSVVDNVDNPAIFVVFSDTSAYPEYLIKYTTENDGFNCIIL